VPLANKRSRGDQIENAAYFESRGLLHVLPERGLAEKDALTDAISAAFADGSLSENLREASFTAGNEAIRREIEKCCK